MDEIAKRIEQILQLRGCSARELSRRSGISEKHVAKVLERGGARAAGETLAKIADGGQVHLKWLISGEGPRDLPPDITTEYTDRYFNRAAVIEMYRSEVHAKAIEALRGYKFHGEDPTRMEWTRWLMAENEKVLRDERDKALAPVKPAKRRAK